MTITLVKLPDDDLHQKLAASNNVNNNVPYSNDHNPGLDSARKTSPMTSKEIQTSTTNIPDLPASSSLSSTTAAAANKKFERGRGPHLQKTSPNQGDDWQHPSSIAQQPERQEQSQHATVTTRCSNPNCQRNTPSSSKRLLCTCGSLMVKVSNDHQGNGNNKQVLPSQGD